MGSTQLTFTPQEPFKGGKVECGAKSAQSTSLILQCLLPILVLAPNKSELTIRGGTTVSKSPPNESVKFCLLDLLRMMGVQLEYNCIKEGYYPEGRGIVKVGVTPSKLRCVELLEKVPLREGVIKLYLTKEQPFKECVKAICKESECDEVGFREDGGAAGEERNPLHSRAGGGEVQEVPGSVR